MTLAGLIGGQAVSHVSMSPWSAAHMTLAGARPCSYTHTPHRAPTGASP
jgi:hypothetical protein